MGLISKFLSHSYEICNRHFEISLKIPMDTIEMIILLILMHFTLKSFLWKFSILFVGMSEEVIYIFFGLSVV